MNKHVLEIFAPLSSSSSSSNSRRDQSSFPQTATKARNTVVAFIHGGAWGSGRCCLYYMCVVCIVDDVSGVAIWVVVGGVLGRRQLFVHRIYTVFASLSHRLSDTNDNLFIYVVIQVGEC